MLQLILTIIIGWFALRYFSRLLQVDDRRQAGQRIERDLTRLKNGATSCLLTGCKWYVIACAVAIIVGVLGAAIH